MTKTLTSQVLELTSLVDYQEGTIVSKMLINKSTGSVTVFAFDKDQELSEHTAPFDAMVQVIEGSATITISGKSYTVSTGNILIMPAHKPHAVQASTPFKMMLVMIKS